MAVLGVIILIVVAVVAVTVIGKGGDPVALELPGVDIDTTASGVFTVGAGSSLLGVLGVVLVIGGARRGNRRRHEVKALRRDADHAGGAGSGAPGAEGAGGGARGTPPDDGRREDLGARGRTRHDGPDGGRRREGRRGPRNRDDGDGDHFATVPRD